MVGSGVPPEIRIKRPPVLDTGGSTRGERVPQLTNILAIYDYIA
jgi:hypothetical protein